MVFAYDIGINLTTYTSSLARNGAISESSSPPPVTGIDFHTRKSAYYEATLRNASRKVVMAEEQQIRQQALDSLPKIIEGTVGYVRASTPL